MVVCKIYVTQNWESKTTLVEFEGEKANEIKMRFIIQLSKILPMFPCGDNGVEINRIVPLGEVQSYIDEYFNSDVIEVYQN